MKKKSEDARVRHGRVAAFQAQFREDLRFWVATDHRVALRVLELVEAILRDPFTGIGKPEPLKYVLPGTWSRRLTREHRIVYVVLEDRIDFLQARHHYQVLATHPNAERIQAQLKARGADGEVVELMASTRTSQEAAAAIGTTVAQIAKTLVFLVGGMPILVIASGVNRVSQEKLGKFLEGPVTRPDADTVRRLTGFSIGGVAPLGSATPMRVLIDSDLLQHGEIWAAAGTPNAVFRTTPDELIRLTGGEVIAVAEGK